MFCTVYSILHIGPPKIIQVCTYRVVRVRHGVEGTHCQRILIQDVEVSVVLHDINEV